MSRHPLRWGSLFFGLAFATVVLVWAVAEQGMLSAATAGVVVAVALIVLGLAGVGATIRIARRPRAGSPRSLDGDRLETDRSTDRVPGTGTDTDTDTDTEPDTDDEETTDEEARTQH